MNDHLICSINSATEETLPMWEKNTIVPAVLRWYHHKRAVWYERSANCYENSKKSGCMLNFLKINILKQKLHDQSEINRELDKLFSRA